MSLYARALEHCDVPSSYDVDAGLRALAVESDVLANVAGTFRKMLPALSAQLSDVVQRILPSFGKNALPKELSSSLDYYLTHRLEISAVNYVNIRDVLVTVPEGYKGQLTDFLSTLIKLQPTIFQGSHDLLADYAQTLSTFITNKTAKSSLQDHAGVVRRVGRERQAVADALQAHFPSNSHHGKANIGQLISRMADLQAVRENCLALSQKHTPAYLNELQNMVTKVEALLDMIIKDLNSESMERISPQAAKNIAGGAYEVAKYVELLSLYFFRVEQAYGCVQNLFTAVKQRI